jgi:hypothetical protein
LLYQLPSALADGIMIDLMTGFSQTKQKLSIFRFALAKALRMDLF